MLERWLKSQAGRGGQSGQDEADTEDASDGDVNADGQCPHGVATSAEDAVVRLFLHGRDCLNDQPSQRYLAASFGVHRTKVAELVGSLNGQHPQEAEDDPSDDNP